MKWGRCMSKYNKNSKKKNEEYYDGRFEIDRRIDAFRNGNPEPMELELTEFDLNIFIAILLERNKTIAEIYQEFKDNPTEDSFIKVLIANFLLEGLYFYNGFMFFYNLASRGMMTDTATQIKYINRDELLHCLLFQNIISEIRQERPELFERNKEAIYDLFKKAVEQEIKFSSSIIGDNVLGMSNQSIYEYTNFLANKRLKQLGLEAIFDKTKDPYKHLHAIAGIDDETSNKVNVFEARSISYKSSNILDGWDEI